MQMENFIPSEKYVHGTKLWTHYTAIIVGYFVSIMYIPRSNLFVLVWESSSQTTSSHQNF